MHKLKKMLLNTKYLNILVLLFCISCKGISQSEEQQPNPQQKNFSLHFLDEYSIPPGYSFEGTRVGGLSGIDYVPASNEYLILTDDKSNTAPARYYAASIVLDGYRIDTIMFRKMTYLRDQQNQLYPSSGEAPEGFVDPEAIKYYPPDSAFAWSSEMNATSNGTNIYGVFLSNSAGKIVDKFPLPDTFQPVSGSAGLRSNGGFEGMAFSGDFTRLYVSTEEPLVQDGHRAGPGDSSALVRWIAYDVQQRKPIAQYAYRVDPVAYPPQPENAFKINGITDILWLDHQRFLVTERSFSTGRLTNVIKVYLADISEATHVEDIYSLKDKNIRIIPKKLLLNMESLNIYISNIEGATWGPILPNGNRSIIFVADNNFIPFLVTQFFLFELKPS